jgi:hypothetical protein
MKTISRAAAKKLGLKKYFTEKQCQHGHIDERYVGNRECVACRAERDAVLRATPERIAAQRAYDAAYNATAKGRATQRERHSSR